MPYEPSIQQVKNWVTVNIIIPLSSDFVRDRLTMEGKKLIKNVLFFGPKGTGKRTMAKAIA